MFRELDPFSLLFLVSEEMLDAGVLLTFVRGSRKEGRRWVR